MVYLPLVIIPVGLAVAACLIKIYSIQTNRRRNTPRRRPGSAELPDDPVPSPGGRPRLERLDDYRRSEPAASRPADEIIVGFNPPSGYWTKKLFAEKMDYFLYRLGGSDNKTGYWTWKMAREKAQRQQKNPGRNDENRRRGDPLPLAFLILNPALSPKQPK